MWYVYNSMVGYFVGHPVDYPVSSASYNAVHLYATDDLLHNNTCDYALFRQFFYVKIIVTNILNIMPSLLTFTFRDYCEARQLGDLEVKYVM